MKNLLFAGIVVACFGIVAGYSSGEEESNQRDVPSLDRLSFENGKVAIESSLGKFSAVQTVALSLLETSGNPKVGLLSRSLRVDGKAVCTVTNRAGSPASIVFYIGDKRIELKRSDGGEWRGKEFDTATADALF